MKVLNHLKCCADFTHNLAVIHFKRLKCTNDIHFFSAKVRKKFLNSLMHIVPEAVLHCKTFCKFKTLFTTITITVPITKISDFVLEISAVTSESYENLQKIIKKVLKLHNISAR